MSDWCILYVNDIYYMWMMKACMNLMSYIQDNVWDVVYWYIKYEKTMVNKYPIVSLMI